MNNSSQKSSDVWNFFKKGNNASQCNLCGKMYKTGGGTTNLKNHLKRKHSSRFLSNSEASSTSNLKRKPTTENQKMHLDGELKCKSTASDPDDEYINSDLESSLISNISSHSSEDDPEVKNILFVGI